MNVTIELSEEQAAVLKVQAEALGLTIEHWLEQAATAAAQLAPSTSIAHLQQTNPEEWARASFISGPKLTMALDPF